MGADAYGRPFRRRKAAALAGQPLCSICGRPILRPQDGTLHHDPPVTDGGNAFSERPAHKSCNASHGGRLGAARSGRRRDEAELELPVPGPRAPARFSRYPRVWPGAITPNVTGPADIIHPDGTVTRLEAGQRWP
jgi:hypothetical protein